MTERVLPYQSPESPAPPNEKAREVFGVIVRTAGILTLLYGLSNVASVIAELATSSFPAWSYIATGVIFVAAGIAMVRGEWIVRFAYGRRTVI